MLRDLIEILSPPRCLTCNEDLRQLTVGRSKLLPNHLCNSCDQFFGDSPNGNFKLLSDAECCERCGEPVSKSKTGGCLCAICQLWPPPTRNMRSLVTYSHLAKRALKKLKYEGHIPLAKYYAHALAEAVTQKGIFPTRDWDVIVPLPSADLQARVRGFNHTALISKHFGKMIGCHVDPYALRSVGSRLSQAKLKDSSRVDNVNNTFRGIPQRVSGLSVLLFDDVITTGSSAWSATLALLDAGAESVDVVSIARSRSFRRRRLISASLELDLQEADAVEIG